MIGTQPTVQQWRDLGAEEPPEEYPPANFTTLRQMILRSIGAAMVITGYDGTSGEITSYTRGGVPHTVSYPDVNTIIISNSQGYTKTITRSAGRIISIS